MIPVDLVARARAVADRQRCAFHVSASDREHGHPAAIHWSGPDGAGELAPLADETEAERALRVLDSSGLIVVEYHTLRPLASAVAIYMSIARPPETAAWSAPTTEWDLPPGERACFSPGRLGDDTGRLGDEFMRLEGARGVRFFARWDVWWRGGR